MEEPSQSKNEHGWRIWSSSFESSLSVVSTATGTVHTAGVPGKGSSPGEDGGSSLFSSPLFGSGVKAPWKGAPAMATPTPQSQPIPREPAPEAQSLRKPLVQSTPTSSSPPSGSTTAVGAAMRTFASDTDLGLSRMLARGPQVALSGSSHHLADNSRRSTRRNRRAVNNPARLTNPNSERTVPARYGGASNANPAPDAPYTPKVAPHAIRFTVGPPPHTQCPPDDAAMVEGSLVMPSSGRKRAVSDHRSQQGLAATVARPSDTPSGNSVSKPNRRKRAGSDNVVRLSSTGPSMLPAESPMEFSSPSSTSSTRHPLTSKQVNHPPSAKGKYRQRSFDRPHVSGDLSSSLAKKSTTSGENEKERASSDLKIVKDVVLERDLEEEEKEVDRENQGEDLNRMDSTNDDLNLGSKVEISTTSKSEESILAPLNPIEFEASPTAESSPPNPILVEEKETGRVGRRPMSVIFPEHGYLVLVPLRPVTLVNAMLFGVAATGTILRLFPLIVAALSLVLLYHPAAVESVRGWSTLVLASLLYPRWPESPWSLWTVGAWSALLLLPHLVDFAELLPRDEFRVLLFVALLNAPYVADMRRVDAAVYAGFLGAVILYSGLAIAGQLVVQLVPALYIPVFLFNLLLLATLLGLGCTATYLPVHRRLRTNIRLKHAYSK